MSKDVKEVMEGSEQKGARSRKVYEVKIFPVPFSLKDIKKNITITSNFTTETSKEKILNQAITLHSQGNISEATKYYQCFINQGFKDYRVFSNYGSILKSLGKLQEAKVSLHKAIELKPDFAESHFNLGNILKDLGKLQEAEESYRKAIELNSDFTNAHSNLGTILKDLGKLQEAEESYRKAIQLNPDFTDAHLNLGSILRDIGQLQEAELSTRKAIELNPEIAESHFNLGNILRDIGQLQEAELSTRKAIELNPNLADAYYTLGLILLERGKQDSSLQYFISSADLRRDQKKQNFNNRRFTTISKAKIEHDIEQFEYLASKSHETEKFSDLAILYKKIAAEINWPSRNQLISLSNKYKNLLRESYNCLIHQVETSKLKKGAVNNLLNVEAITHDYFDHEFGLTYIDNFLTPSALKSLRSYLLGSTIWFNIKENGYLGAYLEEGLANPLIIQIADELRQRFTRIFKNYPICQIWAYKYDNRTKKENNLLRGINIHADQAAINVNFWITPNDANLNPDSGGLVVYDVEAPKDWDFATYNSNEKLIRRELKKSKGCTKVIPHNENRAVIFNSNLFHETDNYEFKQGYENRRINVTILFGRRSDS